MKTCTRCKTTKDLNKFYNSVRSKDGLKSWCSSCDLEHNRNYRNSTIGKQIKQTYRHSIVGSNQAREAYLRSTYGMTYEEYKQL